MPGSSLPTSRRAALGVLLGASAVTGLGMVGCTIRDDAPAASTPPTPGTSGSGERSSSPSPTAGDDGATVNAVVAALGATHAQVVAIGRSNPGLRSTTTRLQRLHEAHGETLGGLATVPRSRVRSGDTDKVARRRLSAAEAALQRTLSDAAVAVASGDLAATLASMAAAVAQQRAVL